MRGGHMANSDELFLPSRLDYSLLSSLFFEKWSISNKTSTCKITPAVQAFF
jgi:hypothetical protein